jgi:hypothetical protein
MRFDTHSLYVRNGAKKLTPSVPVANASLRGCWNGYLSSENLIYAAYRVGSYTRIYSLDPLTFAWTELTHDGTGLDGAYAGNTRFPTDGDVVFSPSHNPVSGDDFVIVQNGTDYPRVIQGTSEAGALVTIHQPVVPPNAPNSLQAVLTWPVVTQMSTTTNVSGTAYHYLQLSQSGSDETPIVTFVATATGSSFPTINWALTGGTGQNLANSRYLIFLCQSGTTPATSTPYMWNQIQVCAQDGTTPAGGPDNVHMYPVWTPATSQYAPVYIPDIDPNDPTKFAVAFSLAGLDLTQPAFTNFQQVTLFYGAYGISTAVPTVGTTCKILAICGDGVVPGSSQYGISYGASGSGAESYGQLITNLTTQTVKAPQGSPYASIKIPNSPLLYYDANVSFQNVSAGQIQNGVDQVGIYRMDPGEFVYDLVAYYRTASFTPGTPGSWNTANANAILTYSDTTPTNGKNPTVVWPDAYQQCIPIGNSMVSSNSRLYVGGVASGTSSPNSVWISRFQNPFRFSTQIAFLTASQPDLSSAATVQFAGEQVTGLVPVTGTLVGVDTVLAFTNTNGYLLEGSDSVSLSRPARTMQGHGCPYPATITNHLGTTFFVDNEQQVRSYRNGQTTRISRMKIDDKLTTYSLAESSMAVMLDGIYLAVKPPSGSQYTNLLRYDEALQEWMEDALASGDAKRLMTMKCVTPSVIYAFSDAGNVYQLEYPGQILDDATPIVATMKSGAIHNGMWQRVYSQRVGLVGDSGSGLSALTVTRTWMDKWNNAGNDGTISLAADTRSNAWIWESVNLPGTSSPILPGGQGLAVQVQVQGNLPGGYNIYSLVMDLDVLSDADAITG